MVDATRREFGPLGDRSKYTYQPVEQTFGPLSGGGGTYTTPGQGTPNVQPGQPPQTEEQRRTQASNQQQRAEEERLEQLRSQDYYDEQAASYGRKWSDLQKFSPLSIATNVIQGKPAITPLSAEEKAERAYLVANPGQDTSYTSKVFGTGKWEPYHSTEVTSNQKNTNTSGRFEPNAGGLGLNNNVDRFGNLRTDITPDVQKSLDSGSAYWNSTTGNWTDKTSGVPIGGSYTSQPAAARAEAASAGPAGKTNRDTGGSGGNGGK